MKKITCALLALTLVLCLAACGGTAPASSTPTATPGSSTPAPAGTATGWPDKTITLLCGYSAGGSSDLGARYLATGLEKQLGVPVIVENVPGSGSTVAWNRLLKNTDPDGNTFALVNLSILYGHYDETNPRDYTIDDFELLANHVIDYQCVAIRSDETRFTDYASLIEYAKTNTLVVACATTTITSGDATVAKMLEQDFGSKITVVPVEGASDSETMFLAGETDFLVGNVGDMMDAADSGYKVVVVYGDKRSDYLPDVPTAIELGIGDYVSFSARGYAYMRGVDQAIVDRMTEAMDNVFADAEYQKNMSAMGAELELYSGDDYYNLLMGQLDQRLEIWNVTK